MRRDRIAGFCAFFVISVVGGFAGCDGPTEDPVIILPENDGGDLDFGGADARVDGGGFDATPGDGPLPDLPGCLDPCDDGEAATTGDRCIDDVCVGQALPAMLALVGDVPPLGGETRPAAEVVAVRVVDGQVVVEATGARAPRAFYGLGDEGELWATRPLDVVDTTAVLQWDAAAGRFVTWSHRAPLVPGARVVALDGDAVVLVGSDGIGNGIGAGTVMHVAADGFATRLGIGAADANAFVGWVEGRLVARVLGAMPGEEWEPEDIDLEGIEPGAAPVVVGGYGFVPASEGLAMIDVADRRVAALEIGEAPRFGSHGGAGDRWAVVTAGDAVVDFGSWPPRIHRLASAWVDARVVAGAVVALDAAGAVWRSALGDEGPAPLDRLGVLAPGATLVAVTPDGSAVLAVGGESWWLIRADGSPPVALPALAPTFAGFGAAHAFFTAAGRVDALDLAALSVISSDDASIGPPIAVVGETLLVRHAIPAPLTLVRSGPDGWVALSSVWVPERSDLSNEAAPIGVVAAGQHAVFFAAVDGPLMALDVSDPAAVPVPAARINNRANGLDVRLSPDGRWVVWRAGDEVLGTLRGARTDGQHYPDGRELVQSRQYPVVMAPTAARLTVQVSPGPTTGVPVVDLDDAEPDEGLFLLVPEQGTYPLAWVDDNTLLHGSCFGEGCPSWGLGTIRLRGESFDVLPLLGPDPAIRRPEWGSTAMATPAHVYFLRQTARQLLVQRIAIRGDGPWMTVVEGAAGEFMRLWGPVEQGLLFQRGAGRVWYAPPTGVAVELGLPVEAGFAGFGPGGPGRPVVVMAAGAMGAGCADCGAWRLDVEGGAPLRLGSAFDGPLRPIAWSPDGLAVVHHGLDATGRLSPQITGAFADQLAPGPTDDAADVRFVGWLAQ